MSIFDSLTTMYTNPQRFKDVVSNHHPIMTHMNVDKEKAVTGVFQFLKENIPHDDWFIGGSAAYLGSMPFNDIDVFFTDEKKANIAIRALQDLVSKQSAAYSPLDLDPFAPQKNEAAGSSDTPHLRHRIYQNSFMSYNLEISFSKLKSPLTVQLITKNTGTYKEIFDRIDLSACRVAILPSGRKAAHPSAHGDLKAFCLNHETVSRIVKYVDRMYDSRENSRMREIVTKDLIDRFIEDDSPATKGQDFYGPISVNGVTTIPLNNVSLKQQIYKVYTPDSEIVRYFNEQALQRAPELLL